MKVLFVAAEGSPFVKTGGLADVIGSLPRALQEREIDVRVVLPKYSQIPDFYKNEMELINHCTVSVGWRNQYCGIETLEYKGITYYFIDNKYYFYRQGIYGFYDEAERYTFFNKAVLAMLPFIDFTPDIIHCHDWHTALIGLYLKDQYRHYSSIKTVFTIHNLQYQGVFPAEILQDVMGLKPRYFHRRGLEYYGQVNFMKAGLYFSDKITTVSKTYAREIQTPEFGEGLDGVLRERADDLCGIINGLDYNFYNPARDPHLFVNYEDSFARKQKNKKHLQQMLGLPRDKDKPMLILISRLVEQKGIDLLVNALDRILEYDVQLVVLGTGRGRYEHVLREAAHVNPRQLSANITFNENLAHKMYAAGDLYLMPSHFEPDGIGQLIALRYLTVPVVRETGGLVDTVTPYDHNRGEGNGFTFNNYNTRAFVAALETALEHYDNDDLRENILACDFSWQNSAREYKELYNLLVRN